MNEKKLRKEDLNKEMHSYIKSRRKIVKQIYKKRGGLGERKMGIFGKMFGKKQEDDYEFAPGVEFEPPAEVTRQMGETARQEPKINEQKPEKRGWFSRRKEEVPITIKEPTVQLMSKAEQDSRELKDDMKEVTKIFLKSLERLPPEQISSLKKSDEFDKLKTLLKKHELIK